MRDSVTTWSDASLLCMLCCQIFHSLISCSRVCFCASLETNVNRRHIFFRTRGKRIASTKLSPPAEGCTDEQRSHSALVEDRTFRHRHATRYFWHVYQGSNGSYCVKTVLLIERHSGLKAIAVSQGLNFRSRDNLSALEPSDPGPTYILPIFSASSLSKRRHSIQVVPYLSMHLAASIIL